MPKLGGGGDGGQSNFGNAKILTAPISEIHPLATVLFKDTDTNKYDEH